MAISGNNVVIGNPGGDSNATSDGIAYLFDSTTGLLKQTFLNPNPSNFDEFGGTVSTDGLSVLVTAGREDIDGNDTGAVYLFDAASGVLQKTFLDPEPSDFDSFGLATDVGGQIVAIGDRGGLFSGTTSVRIYDLESGDLLQTIMPPEPSPGFGGSIDLDGDILAVGAPSTDAGVVYVFQRIPEPSAAMLVAATLALVSVGRAFTFRRAGERS